MARWQRQTVFITDEQLVVQGANVVWNGEVVNLPEKFLLRCLRHGQRRFEWSEWRRKVPLAGIHQWDKDGIGLGSSW